MAPSGQYKVRQPHGRVSCRISDRVGSKRQMQESVSSKWQTAVVGCGALFYGSTQTISVKSVQRGSNIEVDGQTFVSPASIELRRNGEYVVTISKEGFETQQVRILRNVSGGIVILDVLGGIIPLLIDGLMGTWYKLSPQEIDVNLISKQTGGIDVPVRLVVTNDASVRMLAPRSVRIKIEKAR